MNLSNIALVDLAALVSETLRKYHIDAVLVGGACVSIYSDNRYESSDLDFVCYQSLNAIEAALRELHFVRQGRLFTHRECPYFLDFVNPPVAIGHEPIHQFNLLKTANGCIKLLSPTDCVKDRLAAFFHWKDIQSLEQAIMIAKETDIDLDQVKQWARSEDQADKLETFLTKLGAP
ncbi:MAG: hypothetical protein ACOYKZ_06520 [Chlamydiia bacterium]